MALKRKEMPNAGTSDKGWAEAFRNALLAKVDPVPPGWYRRVEIERMLGYRGSHMRRRIADSIREGRMEMKRFWVRDDQGHRRLIQHYRTK